MIEEFAGARGWRVEGASYAGAWSNESRGFREFGKDTTIRFHSRHSRIALGLLHLRLIDYIY